MARWVRWLGAFGSVGVLALAPVQAATVQAATPTWVQVDAGYNSTCTLTPAGQAYCWGNGIFGQLGTGSTDDSSRPVPVDQTGVLAGKKVASVSGGGDHTCALSAAGKAFCWGANGAGGLGNATRTDSSVPVAVLTNKALHLKTLTRIEAGANFSCALDTAGVAYCWGDNGFGQLGDGSGSRWSKVPVPVSTTGALGGRPLTDLSVGFLSACGLDAAGRAYCWGNGLEGQLGDGSSSGRAVPGPVDATGVLAGKRLRQLSVGYDHACALDGAGLAYCWGLNGAGRLGDGTTQSRLRPVAVDRSGALAGKTLVALSAGGSQTCALDTEGIAYCWGENDRGQLGIGSTEPSAVPVAVDRTGLLAGVRLTQLTTGATHTCGLAAGGAAFCWGGAVPGTLGDGSLGDSSVPVRVLRPAAP